MVATYSIALEALAIAKSHRLVKEATGHNDGAAIEMFQEHIKDLRRQPWCASFISYCFYKACKNLGVKRLFPHISAVLAFKKMGLERGVLYVMSNGKFIPRAGDLALILNSDSSKCHIGIVEKFECGKIFTYEGNYQNKVSYVRSLPSRFQAFIRF